MRRRLVYVIGIVVAAVAGVVYTLIADNEPLLGLDLQGGASVVLEPTRQAEPADLDLAVEIIRNRVDGLGVAEPEISTQGGNILVQLPGVDDQQRAIDLVGQTAELRFRPLIGAVSETDYQQAVARMEQAAADGLDEAVADDGVIVEMEPGADEGAAVDEAVADDGVIVDAIPEEIDIQSAADEELVARYALTTADNSADAEVVLPQYDDDRNVVVRYLLGPTEVTGDSLEGAVALFEAVQGWYVSPPFKPGADGIDLFNELGQRCFYLDPTCPTKQIAIEIDNEVISAPRIQDQQSAYAPFERDNITITGGFTEDEAKDLALVLDYGALPVELEAQQSRIVSASLGTDALEAGMLAGLIGLGLVSLYLLAYYRLLGLVAILSLGLSGALLWTIIAWLGESQGLALTLAGVTGLIVAVGVSVDSNIVYFEHLKEDVRSGRTVRSAVDRAFPVAFSTIVKADFASLIAAVVLYFLTVGQVRGFALYLGLATILDLVATYFFMGPVIALLARVSGLYHNPQRFGIPASTVIRGPASEGSPPARADRRGRVAADEGTVP